MFLQSVRLLSTGYSALHPRIQTFSSVSCLLLFWDFVVCDPFVVHATCSVGSKEQGSPRAREGSDLQCSDLT
jgi:hypothetical protein